MKFPNETDWDDLFYVLLLHRYRAPEVNGTTIQGFGVDIYSYGAMLMRICADFSEMSKDMSAVLKVLQPLGRMW